MRIKLDESYYIEDNGSGYTLVKWTGKTDKRGDQLNDLIKYPASIEHALKLYARLRAIDEREEATLKEYVDSINQSFLLVSRLLQGEQT